MSRARLLIIECIPKREGLDEWRVLDEFLKMANPKKILAVRRSSKYGLINYLRRKRDLPRYDYIHLSGHGDADECIFCTPRGDLAPEDFPEGCFEGKTVTISSCTLGKANFMRRFMDETGARIAIAPLKKVLFVDAALWYATFYYNALHRSMTPARAYNRTQDMLEGMKGGFKYWR